MAQSEDASPNLDVVRASARLNAPDRYYAALFAPSAARDDLISLAAFSGEIERVAREVNDAALAEIRVAWWRDAFLSRGESGMSGNPVLDAFADVIRRRQLRLGEIESYLEAHAAALHFDSAPDEEAFERSLGATDGTPFRLAAEILGLRTDREGERLLDAAARAAGTARIGLDLPYLIRHDRVPLPGSLLKGAAEEQSWRPQIAWLAQKGASAIADVRRYLAVMPRGFTTAVLPLALIGPYFRALQDPRHEPARDIVEIAPIARLWRIARAHWSGRI